MWAWPSSYMMNTCLLSLNNTIFRTDSPIQIRWCLFMSAAKLQNDDDKTLHLCINSSWGLVKISPWASWMETNTRKQHWQPILYLPGVITGVMACRREDISLCWSPLVMSCQLFSRYTERIKPGITKIGAQKSICYGSGNAVSVPKLPQPQGFPGRAPNTTACLLCWGQ